jgi:hypothetical protein
MRIEFKGLQNDLIWRAAPESMALIPIKSFQKFIYPQNSLILSFSNNFWSCWHYADLGVIFQQSRDNYGCNRRRTIEVDQREC